MSADESAGMREEQRRRAARLVRKRRGRQDATSICRPVGGTYIADASQTTIFGSSSIRSYSVILRPGVAWFSERTRLRIWVAGMNGKK